MNLENLDLVEMKSHEIVEVEGGMAINPYIGWALACLAWDIFSNPKAASNAFNAGYNANI